MREKERQKEGGRERERERNYGRRWRRDARPETGRSARLKFPYGWGGGGDLSVGRFPIYVERKKINKNKLWMVYQIIEKKGNEL